MDLNFSVTSSGGGQLTAAIPFGSELARSACSGFWVGITDGTGNLIGRVKFERAVVIGSTVRFAATELRPEAAEGPHPQLVTSAALVHLQGGS